MTFGISLSIFSPIVNLFCKSSNAVKYDKQFEKYLDEVESVTRVPVTKRQRDFLRAELTTYDYTRLSSDEAQQHRRDFNKARPNLIKEWEQNTHMKWGTYDKDRVHNGRVIRRKGANYDAHEIILNMYNSPHEWWNLTPCPTPEHQKQIHGKHSMCNRIFI